MLTSDKPDAVCYVRAIRKNWREEKQEGWVGGFSSVSERESLGLWFGKSEGLKSKVGWLCSFCVSYLSQWLHLNGLAPVCLR